MKAILIIDTPNTCEDCPCMNWASYEDEILCGALGDELFVSDKEEVIKSKRCPLKPLTHDTIKDIDVQMYLEELKNDQM